MRNTYSISAEQVRVKSILSNTYWWMTLGLIITGATALFSAESGFITQLLKRSPAILFMAVIAELGLVFYLSIRIMRMSVQRAMVVFLLYSVLNGFTLSVVFLSYTRTSIYQAFFVSAGAFAGMSIYAMTTKRDLSGLGKYLMMGLFGLIFTSFFAIFFGGTGLTMVISLVGLILFLGLTAYDTQIIMRWSREYSDSDDTTAARLSLLGALKLYLDFINIFLFMLRFMGVSQRE